MSEWISVADRLPENDDWILGLLACGDMEVTAYHADCGWYCPRGGWAPAKHLHPGRRATHWMPLPEPPAK